MPPLAELEPYLTAIAGLLSLATLGFVIRMAVLMRSAEKQRTEIIEERLANVEADLARTEKWSARKRQELTAENESLRAQLEELLTDSGLTIQALAAGRSLKEAQDSIQEAVRSLLRRMEAADQSSGGIGDPAWHLELAKGYMANREWASAAHHFDAYVKLNPSDSETQFSRGVAHANTRSEDLSALRAYNEAIAFAPKDLSRNRRSRYFAYRGAILKRLRRLEEAEADLKLALSMATEDYERHDIKYNLAAVYAMTGNRRELFRVLEELRDRPRELAAIRAHLSDYFKEFANDPEFLAIIAQSD